MKLIAYFCQSQVLLAVLSFASTVSQEIEHHCVHGQDDFYSNGWEVKDGVLKWAASVDSLPELFRKNLRGQYEDVFYFDLSDRTTKIPTFGKFTSGLRPEIPAYIYIKYYAHAPKDAQFFLYPIQGDDIHYFKGSTDFKWREEFIEIDITGFVAIGAFPGPVPGNFFFVDTLILVQGKELSEQEVKDLCPQKDPVPTASESCISTTNDLPPSQQAEFLIRQNELLFQQIKLLNQQIELLNEQIDL